MLHAGNGRLNEAISAYNWPDLEAELNRGGFWCACLRLRL
jgi:hypothetical protein